MKLNQRILRISALLLVLALFSPALKGQEEHGDRVTPEKKEKLKAHKIAFITDRLQLTPAEAEKFWPVYNEHEAAIEAFHKDFRKTHHFEPEDIDSMSDTEANSFIEDHLKNEQQMFDQRKAFLVKLKGIIPSRKILMLVEAEKDFRVEIVRKVAGKDGPPLPYDQERMEKPVKK
jgi:hypothetical protein